MSVWLPPKVSRELMEGRLQREAEAGRALVADAQFKWKKEFDAELARIDPGCKLVWCPNPAPVEAVASGATPGRWHVMRQTYGAPPTFLVIETHDGQFLAPGSHVFDMLARCDLWDERNVRRREQRTRELTAARDRERAREREAFQEELMDRVKAATEVRVSFDRSHRWTQNVAGRRRRMD